MQKIDVFTHIYLKNISMRLLRRRTDVELKRLNARRRLSDLDIRFRIMDLNEGYAQNP